MGSRELDAESSLRSRLHRALPPAAAAAALLAALGLWLWTSAAEQRAIRTLPAAERQALYDRTLANLMDVCGADKPLALRAYCREQAEFVLSFPECDAQCEEVAREILAQRPR